MNSTRQREYISVLPVEFLCETMYEFATMLSTGHRMSTMSPRVKIRRVFAVPLHSIAGACAEYLWMTMLTLLLHGLAFTIFFITAPSLYMAVHSRRFSGFFRLRSVAADVSLVAIVGRLVPVLDDDDEDVVVVEKEGCASVDAAVVAATVEVVGDEEAETTAAAREGKGEESPKSGVSKSESLMLPDIPALALVCIYALVCFYLCMYVCMYFFQCRDVRTIMYNQAFSSKKIF